MRWSEERAWEWYNSRPWLRGCNFVASCCINRYEQWQEYNWENVFEVIDRELGMAAQLGYNTIRSVLPFEVWDQQHDGFMARLEKFIATAAKYGLGLMICFGNDCCQPRELYTPAVLGPQPEPEPGYHGGRKAAPHAVTHTEPAYSILDDPEVPPRFYRMVDEIVGKYARDERVIVWDIFNEPGMTRRDSLSMPHMIKFFEIARSHDPIQPLTAGPWSNLTDGEAALKEIERVGIELSDIITFHSYDGYEKTVRVIDNLRRYNRPLINTEWLHRCLHNNVENMFPLYYITGVGCYNWGLVAGKAQTYEPWEQMYTQYSPDEVDLTKWQHDLFRQNLRPYDYREIECIKRITALADRSFAERRKK